MFVLTHDHHPTIQLQDQGTQISVSGEGFVPGVTIAVEWQYEPNTPGSGVAQGTNNVQTDNDGRFANLVLSLSSATNPLNASDIQVRATDTFTQLSAGGELRMT